MQISIYVAHHLDREFFPPANSIYKPMMCGAINKENTFGYLRDDQIFPSANPLPIK